jgi:hypothetical protein
MKLYSFIFYTALSSGKEDFVFSPFYQKVRSGFLTATGERQKGQDFTIQALNNFL